MEMLNKRGGKSSNDENGIWLGEREYIYMSWLTLQRLLEVKASKVLPFDPWRLISVSRVVQKCLTVC